MGDVYSAADIVNKTLIAKQRVPIYRDASDKATPISYINPGGTVGTVYSYLAANPFYDRSTLWWMFRPNSGSDQYFYAPHREGLYDVDALNQQGVESTEEQLEEEELANLPWYERLIKKYGPAILVTVVAAAAIKGYLSKPRNNG